MPHHIVAVGPATDPVPLIPGEIVIFSVHPSLVPLIFLIFLVLSIGLAISAVFIVMDVAGFLGIPQFRGIIILVPIIVTALIALLLFLNWLNTIYTLTDQRVQWQFGILGKRTRSFDNSDIQAVQVDRGLLGRIFNYGDIAIRSAQQPIPIDFLQITDTVMRADQIEQEAS